MTSYQRASNLCIRKSRINIQRLAEAPKSGAFAVDGNYFGFEEGFYEIGNWTSSFFTGMALLAFQETKDKFFLQQVECLQDDYRRKVFEQDMNTMHDLGFLYTLYSVALYKVTQKGQHRDTALRAAELLVRRFDAGGGYIRAWGRLDERDTQYAGLAIIDCMMNLPLLHWASVESGTDRFREIAVRHADSTLKYFVRPDDSVFHSFRWDPNTGAPRGGDNFCGYSIDSQWARGTAWAVFGFALSYRYTRDEKYLEVALRLARRFVHLLDDEFVPVWDFRLPAGTKGIRDSSAAAIAACGFQELLKFCSDEKVLAETTSALLNRLCSEEYLDLSDACAGVLKFGEVGDGVGKARIAYTSWGDYFFMEALARFLGKGESYW